ncbi:hypothetical protein V491_05864 [Pseudogymnoascus sp. VKM F-3775]|nr:hypothetical protein V491_05864 [Pseudogymnoascus sp. VKM F-3775]
MIRRRCSEEEHIAPRDVGERVEHRGLGGVVACGAQDVEDAGAEERVVDCVGRHGALDRRTGLALLTVEVVFSFSWRRNGGGAGACCGGERSLLSSSSMGSK